MATMFTIKQNDTRPKLVSIIETDGEAVDLTDAASIKFMMRPAAGGTVKINAAVDITDAANGEVTYTWQTGDTDTVDTYDGEFQVTWDDGGIETFPGSGYITIVVGDDIAD